ncbi:MAG TPA: STAS domain-containing protein [Candidatus Polarisedimenticolaceae bacterium]|nr:STAS domain-containing protein [Candidatus Polarisedimenticolaceae bacterium]
MRLERHVVGGCPVISAVETLEVNVGNCEEFRRRFAALLGAADRSVILDAERIGFFDSAGMGSLLSLQKLLRARQGQLAVAALNRATRAVFGMVGFDVVFPTFADVASAVGALRGEASEAATPKGGR